MSCEEVGEEKVNESNDCMVCLEHDSSDSFKVASISSNSVPKRASLTPQDTALFDKFMDGFDASPH